MFTSIGPRLVRTSRQPLRFGAATLLLGAALASATLAQTVVTVSPTSGPPTDRATVGGTGFALSEAVDIYFDTTDLALAATNRSGAFSGIGLTIPVSAVPGTHWITGIGQRSGFAAQTTFIVQTDWRQFHSGPQHHGDNPTENVLNVSNVAGLQLLWSIPIGTEISFSSPAVVNGVVYIGAGICCGSAAFYLYAFNAATGKQLWSADTGGGVTSSPAVADGVVYVVGGDLRAFDAASGKLLWKAPASTATAPCSPAVANGVVYAGSSDGALQAFNAATGQRLWSAPTGGYLHSSPAVANGVVYVGSDDFKLYAFDAATGQSLWAATTGSWVWESPAVQNGVVYVGSQDNNLYAYDAVSGQTLWSTPSAGTESSPAVANGVVYVGGGFDLNAFNAATGEQLWSTPTGFTIDSSPAVANGVVYVGSCDYYVYAFDAETGQQIWRAPTGFYVESSPAVANGVVYVGSDDGNLYAFGLPHAGPPARPDPGMLKPEMGLLRRP